MSVAVQEVAQCVPGRLVGPVPNSRNGSVLLGPFQACRYGPFYVVSGLFLRPRYRSKLRRLSELGIVTTANIGGVEDVNDNDDCDDADQAGRKILSYTY
jgi:hypothetical protein